MSNAPQIRIPAIYLRGGTSKGTFFRLQDMPASTQMPGAARDRLFQRVVGSPDPYAAHIDGMGGATSSTSKCVILATSARPDHDVDYLYGQVSIDKSFVDWSGNCGEITMNGKAGFFSTSIGGPCFFTTSMSVPRSPEPWRKMTSGQRSLPLAL